MVKRQTNAQLEEEVVRLQNQRNDYKQDILQLETDAKAEDAEYAALKEQRALLIERLFRAQGYIDRIYDVGCIAEQDRRDFSSTERGADGQISGREVGNVV